MNSFWGFVIQIGVWALNSFIQDLAKRQRMKQAFLEFVAMRGDRARQTVELFKSAQDQSADLDEIEKRLEEERKAKASAPPKNP